MRKLIFIAICTLTVCSAFADIRLVKYDGAVTDFSDASVQRLDFTQQGVMQVIGPDGTSQSFNLEELQRVEFGVTGINDALQLEQQLTISIYPNPTHDAICIDNLSDGTQARIYDVNGKLIKQAVGSGKTTTIKVGELQNGMYILQINNQSVKFIKD
ncbi:MAG: T9SS type A sorting domain-containing protein [Paludibacteraceae bacterium]|nr:T9SS type A sorting domain-containing protein [Paludibacteraceae bacterium]